MAWQEARGTEKAIKDGSRLIAGDGPKIFLFFLRGHFYVSVDVGVAMLVRMCVCVQTPNLMDNKITQLNHLLYR